MTSTMTTRADGRPPLHWARLLAWMALGLVGAALVLAVLALWMAPRPPARRPTPEPNGFVDLLRAGRSVADVPTARIDRADEPTLRPFVEKNAPALEAARVGLGRDSLVPLVVSPDFIQEATDSIGPLRGLGRLFQAESRLATLQGRPDDAFRATLDQIRLGRAARDGGVLIHFLASVPIESAGLADLRAASPKLGKDDLLRALALLRAVERADEPIAAIARRDFAYGSSAQGWTTRLAMGLPPIRRKLEDLNRPAIASAERAQERLTAERRRAMLDLALRLFIAEHGAPPETLSELVPATLDAIPVDPTTGKAFPYRRQGADYELSDFGIDAGAGDPPKGATPDSGR